MPSSSSCAGEFTPMPSLPAIYALPVVVAPPLMVSPPACVPLPMVVEAATTLVNEGAPAALVVRKLLETKLALETSPVPSAYNTPLARLGNLILLELTIRFVVVAVPLTVKPPSADPLPMVDDAYAVSPPLKVLSAENVLVVVVLNAVVNTPVEELYASGYVAESEVLEILFLKMV